MEQIDRTLATEKNIALVAHDHCKSSLLEWVKNN
ncbi:methylglyoxal synthase, partial [Klebsiella quasipneumoniae]|nr:methylglyoxal synthase [Klebsiella quasipneumoniae]